MRILKSCVLTTFALSGASLALADEGRSNDKLNLSDIELPTKAEIQNMLDDMPDFNKLMDGMMAVATDEELMSSLEETGEKLAEKFEKVGDIEMRDNGLPDVNLLMEEMMMTFADDDVMGDMLSIVQILAESIDENFDEELIE